MTWSIGRKGGPHQITVHWTLPWTPAKTHGLQLPCFGFISLTHTHARTHTRLVPPCWAPLSLCSSIGTHFDKKEGLHTTCPQIFYTSLAARWQNYQHELDLIENTATQKQLCTGYPKHIMGSLQTFLLKIITLRSKSWALFSHFFTRSHLQLSSLWHKIIGVNSFRLYYNTIISGTWNRP